MEDEPNSENEILAGLEALKEGMARAIKRAEKNPEKVREWLSTMDAIYDSPEVKAHLEIVKTIKDDATAEKLILPSIRAKFNLLVNGINSESLRAKIIVVVSQIDEVLGELLIKRLKPSRKSRVQDDELFRRMAPLNSFSVKIALAYRTGLISRPRADALDILREIRNFCSHEVAEIALNHNKMAGWVSQFMKYSCATAYTKEYLADSFAALPRLRFGPEFGRLLPSYYGASFHPPTDAGHWLEVMASVLKLARQPDIASAANLISAHS